MLVVAKAQEATWTDVMGAKVLFDPITRSMLRRARKAALLSLDRDDDGGADAPVADQLEDLGDALSLALLMEGTRDWKDVFQMADPDDDGQGEPLPCTLETKALAFSDALTFEAFDSAYVVPYVTRERKRAAPGNVSATSPNGTGEVATPEPIIAGSPAPGLPGVDASTASTSPTPRKRTRKKTSGRS